jgi:excisionase family DNA binding protein
MRGLGEFQRGQMSDIDPRVRDLFDHLRHSLDAFEQIMLRPHKLTAESKMAPVAETKVPVPAPSIPADEPKLSYTVKEVRKLIGISTATLYKILGRRELRAVKLGNRTLISAKDLQEWLNNLPAMR